MTANALSRFLVRLRVVLYARVSTDQQAEKGFSIPSQLDAMRRYAENLAAQWSACLEIVEEITDDYTGVTLERPGMERVRAHLRDKTVDAVIFYSSDRVVRNLAQKLILREEFARAGVEIHYVSRGRLEDTAEGRMTDNIEGVFDEYWKEMIREGSVRGKNRKAHEGKNPMCHQTNYGYAKVGAKADAVYRRNEAELANVLLMKNFLLYGDGNSGPMTSSTIAKTLNERGIEPPKVHRRAALEWSPATVLTLLRNPIYSGVIYYGQTRMINGKRTMMPREEWVEIPVPDLAIYDSATYAAIQGRLDRNSQLARRNSRRPYLMSGYLYCAACGRRMSGHTVSPGCPTYRCSAAGPYRVRRLGGHCPQKGKHVVCHKIDAIVWGWLIELLSDGNRRVTGLRRMHEREAEAKADMKRQLDIAEAMIAKAERSITALAADLTALQSEGEDGEEARAAIRAQMVNLSKQRKALAAERERLMTVLGETRLTAEDEARLTTEAARIRQGMPDADFETKRFFLDRLRVRAVFRYVSETERYLDLSCELAVTPEAHDIPAPTDKGGRNGRKGGVGESIAMPQSTCCSKA